MKSRFSPHDPSDSCEKCGNLTLLEDINLASGLCSSCSLTSKVRSSKWKEQFNKAIDKIIKDRKK